MNHGIKGIGIDIVDIQKFKRVCSKYKDSFLKRIFCEEEINYSFSKKNPYQHLAARFATKEAVIKALGKNIGFKNIQIKNLDSGKPLCKILDKKFRKIKVLVSLSHLEKYATAVAVVIE